MADTENEQKVRALLEKRMREALDQTAWQVFGTPTAARPVRQDALFDSLPRSRPRRSLGHVIDAGDNGLAEGKTWARLQCPKGHTWEAIGVYTITQLKRGIPCDECAKAATRA